MNIQIKNLTKEQLNEAATVFVQAFGSVGEKWTHEIALGHLKSTFSPEYYFGAFLEEKMIGIMTTKLDYICDHKELYIDIFAVLPEYQKKHIGQMFFNKIEDFAKEKDLKMIWLMANSDLPSYNFYIKNNFTTSAWIALTKTL